MLLFGLYGAPLEAAVIGSVHPRARAISLAVMGLAAGTTGGVLGPVTVGALSDWLEPAYGALSLRWAIIAIVPFYAWSGLHLWIASKSYRDEAGAGAGAGAVAVEDGVPLPLPEAHVDRKNNPKDRGP